jgi:hypothetical protein
MEQKSEINKEEREPIKVVNFKYMVKNKNPSTPSNQMEISNIFSNVNNEDLVLISN